MITHTKRTSLAWTLFLIFLFTTQVQDTEAGMSFKLKKLLKKVLLLRALTPKKGITIIPIPIPLNLFMKDKMDMMKMMPEKMPEGMPMPEMAPMQMPMPSYPMYMPGGNKMMGYEKMPKEMMMPKDTMMPPPRIMMMGRMKYGMMGSN